MYVVSRGRRERATPVPYRVTLESSYLTELDQAAANGAEVLVATGFEFPWQSPGPGPPLPNRVAMSGGFGSGLSRPGTHEDVTPVLAGRECGERVRPLRRAALTSSDLT